MDEKFYRLETWNTIYEYAESLLFWKMIDIYDDKDKFVFDGFVTMLGYSNNITERLEELKTEMVKCDDGMRELFISALLKKSFSISKPKKTVKDDKNTESENKYFGYSISPELYPIMTSLNCSNISEEAQHITIRAMAKNMNIKEDEVLDTLFREGLERSKEDSEWGTNFFATIYLKASIESFFRIVRYSNNEYLYDEYGLNDDEIALIRDVKFEED